MPSSHNLEINNLVTQLDFTRIRNHNLDNYPLFDLVIKNTVQLAINGLINSDRITCSEKDMKQC
jgi:hypothetical protein